METLLSTILEALAEPAVSYIGLGYDRTIGIRTGMCSYEALDNDSVTTLCSLEQLRARRFVPHPL